MPRGGARPGAGRPHATGPVTRAVTARLDAEGDAALAALEVRWRVSAAEAVRRAIVECAGPRFRDRLTT
jgi:hypothetical protein